MRTLLCLVLLVSAAACTKLNPDFASEPHYRATSGPDTTDPQLDSASSDGAPGAPSPGGADGAKPASPADLGMMPGTPNGSTPDLGNCQAESDAELCAALDADCGQPVVVDRCGHTRLPSCGTCTNRTVCFR